MRALLKNTIFIIISFLISFGSLSFKHISPDNKFVNTEKFVSNYFNRTGITDGPYIFFENGKTIVKWIYQDRLVKRIIHNDNFKVLHRKFGFEFKPEWIEENKTSNLDYVQKFDNVENLIAISDVHGQFNVMVKLLRKHKVIDKDYNWIFEGGHLVVLGDIMDRGPHVTESLWLIFQLEQQAKKAGGKVHVLLGNHELMVLNNDIRYIHEKYINSSKLMKTTYSHLYSENSFLGNWLRKKPVFVTINDMLFVHAGVTTDFIKKGYTRAQINKLFTEDIVGQTWNTILANPISTFMMESNGPIWYRGYFDEPVIKEYQVDHLLNYFNVDHIIVGHTSMPNVVSLFNGKIFGIDSSIKYGDYGELLIYKKGKYYRGSLNGSLIDLN